MSTFGALVNGKIVATDKKHPVINPSTEEVIADFYVANEEALNIAVKAANIAQSQWCNTDYDTRKKLLLEIAEIVSNNKNELAKLLTMEQGKPFVEAVGEIDMSIAALHHYSEQRLDSENLVETDNLKVVKHYTPYGVVAGIIPWNFPFAIAISKLAPALITGNSVILKPAPTTPLSTMRLGALIAQIVPPGLVQILGDDGSVGEKLVSHPDVHKISFTGSTPTGKKVMRSAASHLKRLNLELGGNDPAIVLADADVAVSAATIATIAFLNSGQVCTAIKRVYVHNDVYDEFCDTVVGVVDQFVQGDGLDPASTHGPVQNLNQYEKLVSLLTDAKQSGRVLLGGEVPNQNGYFISPTVIADLDDSSPLVSEEQFGPILPILRFDDEDEVIQRANSSAYGLTASIWSSDIELARQIARQIDAGTVWINKHLDLNFDYPMSPCKESGIGVELGDEGLKQFAQLHVVNG